MYLRRTAIIAAVLCGLSGSAGAFVVFDPLNTLEHSFLNGWRETIGIVLTQQLDTIRQLAKRLSAFTSLGKYVAPNAPLWSTSGINNALPASDAFMDALNRGDQTGRGYAAVARSRVPVGSAFAELGEERRGGGRAPLRAGHARHCRQRHHRGDRSNRSHSRQPAQRSRHNRGARERREQWRPRAKHDRRARQDQRGKPDSGAATRHSHGAADRAHRAAARRFKARPRHRRGGDEHAADSSEPRSIGGGELAGGLGGRLSLLASTVMRSGKQPCLQNHG